MSSPDAGPLDSDKAFEILSSQRRRMVLYYLRQHGGTATMDELPEQIAAWENDTTVEELTSQQRKRVYVSLYQTHLPKLADTGLVEYDVDEGVVALTDRANQMDAFLSSTDSTEYPWRRHYVGLVLVSAAVMIGAVLASPILGQTTVILVAAAVIVGYLATVLVEYWYHRRRESDVPPELVPQNGSE